MNLEDNSPNWNLTLKQCRMTIFLKRTTSTNLECEYMSQCLLLKHKPELGYRVSVKNKNVSKLLSTDVTYIITFDNITNLSGATKNEKYVDALDIPHLFDFKPEDKIATINLESRTPFFPIIYWYILHKMNVGQEIEIIEENNHDLQILKSYFKYAFKLINDTGIKKCFQKTQPLLTEDNRGLHDWSFCIPTGPGDASMLNNLVKQILEYKIPKKEILLCGRPGDNFLYWNDVRIIGEDIPAPPVQIAKKKNVLAKNAKYNNLCILHDRVLLPYNFHEAILKHGDDYPLVAFQSVYMLDKLGALPQRYSDFNTIKQGLLPLDLTSRIAFLNSAMFQMFLYYTTNTYPKDNYITGSLYLAKKNLWNHYPQSEALFWAECEDVEYGIRTTSQGIPSICNPYTITFSQRGRIPILGKYQLTFLKSNNTTITYPYSKTLLSLFPLKPILSTSSQDYLINIDKYIDKYCPTFSRPSFVKLKISNKQRYMIVIKLIFATQIQRTLEFASAWYRDICNLLVQEQPIDRELLDIQHSITNPGQGDFDIKRNIINSLQSLKIQTANGFFGPLLTDTPTKYPKHYALYSGFVAQRLLRNPHFHIKMNRNEAKKTLEKFMEKSNEN